MPQVLSQPMGLLRLRELCDTLEGSERTLLNFFDAAPDLLAVVDFDGCFIKVNPSWQKILGWTEEDLEETPWLDLIHEDDQESLREVVEHLITQNLDRVVCKIRNSDGGYQTIEFSATKWRGGLSNLIGRVVPDACSSCPEASPRLTWRAHGCNDCQQKRTER